MMHKDNNMFRVMYRIKDMCMWVSRSFEAPCPSIIKDVRLLKNGIEGSIWVETGTYRGWTTSLLSKSALRVYSIEPEPKLFRRAKHKFANVANVEIVNGASEEVFPKLIPTLRGDVSFWLDGHYSGSGTYKGALDTPVVKELECIAQYLNVLQNVVVVIDDIRLFTGAVHSYGEYPRLNMLVEWANVNGFVWHIEYDMFVAKRSIAR
jgi:hypothetical protein